jgi:hypothetical protein
MVELKRVRWALAGGVIIAGGALCGGAAKGDAEPDPFGAAATAPATAPMLLVVPTVDAAHGTVTLPAAFWNQHLAGWIEMAVTGMESEFLHETIVAIPTARPLFLTALRKAGFHDADAWTFSVTDFPRVRGDQALILLNVTRNGKVETYSLNELLCIGGWNVSPGPLGWMFKGDPGNPNGAAGDVTQFLDPEVALQNHGLQHLADSVIDYPLSYDDWIEPLPKYVRNYSLLPAAVYDSNGGVPVQIVIKKVTERELLQQSAAVWHDKAQAAEFLKLVPVACQIDADKQSLWRLMPALRDERSAATQPTTQPNATAAADSDEARVLAARIDQGYCTIDAALVDFAATHIDPTAAGADDDKPSAAAVTEAKQNAQAFAAHLKNKAEAAAAITTMEDAEREMRAVAAQHVSGTYDRRYLYGVASKARGQADLLRNSEILTYWAGEQARLDPHDPRVEYLRQIHTEFAVAQTTANAAQAQIDLGDALIKNTPDLAAKQHEFAHASEAKQAAQLQLALFNVEFEISKRQGIENDPEMPELLAQQAAIKAKIAGLMGNVTTAPARQPPTMR